jgi:5-keto 4-deoxyuronate isomerase
MAFTQAQIDALDTAIASGTLRVRHGDKDITYRSVDEMMAARSAMVRALATDSYPTRGIPRVQLADFSD